MLVDLFQEFYLLLFAAEAELGINVRLQMRSGANIVVRCQYLRA